MTHTLKHLLTATLLSWACISQSQAHDIPEGSYVAQQVEQDPQALAPALWAAIEAEDDDLVAELLNNGANPETPNAEGIVPLVYAAERELYHVAVELVNAGADIEGGIVNGGIGWTPLQWAARNDDGFLIEFLTQRGANANAITTLTLTDGSTFRASALMIAAAYGHPMAVMSLELGPNPADIITALRLAVEGGFVDAVNSLLPEADGEEDEEELPLVEGNVGFNENGLTLLQLAIINGDILTAQLLIQRGANVNAWTHVQFQDGNAVSITPLSLLDEIEEQDHTQELRQLLLNAGATTTTNPLHLAAINGETAFIEALLATGTDINAPHAATGNTALHFAARSFQEGALALLAEADEINLNAQNESGETALHILAINHRGEVEPIHNLLERGANPDVINNEGESPLDVAVRRADSTMARILIHWGANTGTTDTEGNTHLHRVITEWEDNLEMLTVLLQGSEVNGIDNAIHPDLQNIAGETALHIAVRFRDTSAIQILLEAGADANITNNAGQTPRAMAEEVEEGENVESILALLPAPAAGSDSEDVVSISDDSAGSPDGMSVEYAQNDEMADEEDLPNPFGDLPDPFGDGADSSGGSQGIFFTSSSGSLF